MAQSPLLAPPAEIDLIHDDDTPMVSLAKTSWADTLPAFAEASSALGEDAVLPEWPESSHGYAGVSVGVVASTPSKAAAIDVDELYPDGCLSTSLPTPVTVTPAKPKLWLANTLTPQAPTRHLTYRSRAVPLRQPGSDALFWSRPGCVNFASSTGLASANIPEVTEPLFDPKMRKLMKKRLADSLDTEEPQWISSFPNRAGPSLKRRMQLMEKMC